MEHDEHDEPNTLVYMAMLLILLLCFFIVPCISSPSRRRLCTQRIRERRWIPAPEYDEDDWYMQSILRREEERKAAAQIEHEKVRSTHLVELLKSFSTTLGESDIEEIKGESKNEGTDENQSSTISSSSGGGSSGGSGSGGGSSSPEVEGDQLIADIVDVEAPNFTDDFSKCNEILHVPLPGQKGQEGHDGGDESQKQKLQRRQVPNGCAICLSSFLPNEVVTWSSNPDCPHVYHNECIIQWFEAAGRKTEKQRLRQNPDEPPVVTRALVNSFPKVCPACRRPYCITVREADVDGQSKRQNERRVRFNTADETGSSGDDTNV